MAELDGVQLSSSQTLYDPASSRSSSKLCSQIYKAASQLFLTRRLQESYTTLVPIITAPVVSDDTQITTSNGDGNVDVDSGVNGHSPTLAPIAYASSNVRIKVWNLYITLLSNVIDLGPEEGKREFGQKEWKALVSKVRDGSIWEEIVKTGYQGLEGSVDADVINNLGTLLLTHSPSQALNQQRLETYLSAYRQPDLDIATYMENSAAGSRRITRNGGTDTPKDLAARVQIIELFTLHVLPKNGEWDYAAEFIRLSEVLDEERKELLLQTLDELKQEKERGNQRAAELQREKEAELERLAKQQEEEQRRRAQAEAERAEQKTTSGHTRTKSGSTEKSSSQSTGRSRPIKGADKPASSSDNIKSKTGTTRRTAFPSPSSSSAPSTSKNFGERGPPGTSMSRRVRVVYTVLRNIGGHIQNSVAGNPTALLRTILFMLGFILAVSRQDVRARIQRLTNSSWEKIKGTVGMGVKVSYI